MSSSVERSVDISEHRIDVAVLTVGSPNGTAIPTNQGLELF